MKRILLSLSIFTSALLAAQDCSNLFISEYVEGTGNNKAIEIYNPTGNPISLNGYRLIRWDNGSVPPIPPTDIMDVDPSKVYVFPDSLTIQPFDVLVFGINYTTDPDPTQNTFPELVNKLDVIVSFSCNPSQNPPTRAICQNGDDAMELQQRIDGNWVSVDIFGCIGEQPTNSSGTYSPTGGWTALSPYFTIPDTYNATVQGPYYKQYWTANHSMIRKSTVLKGITTNPTPGQLGPPVVPSGFNPSVEWDTIPVNIFDSLGTHTCNCSYLFSTEEEQLTQIKYVIYPNPANEIISISATQNLRMIEMYNMAGQLVKQIPLSGIKNQAQISVADLPKGIYLIETHFTSGIKQTKKIVVE